MLYLQALTVSRQELAVLLGLSSARIGQLVGESVIPAATGHGRYLLAECVRKYCAHTRSDSRSKGSQAFVNARAEWMRSKARKAALEEKVLSDQWIPVAVMTEAWCAIGAIMRTRYLGVPSLLAARHATLDLPQKLFDCAMNLINESLEEIQKLDLKDLPIKWEGEPDDEAA